MNKKAIIIVLDSVGIGELPDAANYGDKGADTLGHIINTCHPKLPHLMELGLANIDGASFPGRVDAPKGCFGKLREVSAGKDTTTGHWEIAGVQLAQAFPTFPNGFPQDFIERFEKAVGRGTLGNKPASGTAILDELGEEHIRTGKLIVYTSADSVFQIAANEAVVPLEELYRDCQIARELLTGEPRHRASVRRRPRGRVQAHRRAPRFQRAAAADDVRHSERERQDGLRRGQD